MSKISRLKIIQSILKQAGYLTDVVDKQIRHLTERNENESDVKSASIEYSKPITAVVPGAQVLIPKKPFDDNGGYNVMFVFRYRHDTQWNQGINTIIVLTDVGTQYNAQWISNALNRIQTSLKLAKPNAHLKNYGISAHSGGYSVAGRLLREKDTIERMVGKPIDALVLADAGHDRLHPSAMDPYVEFAQDATKGNRNFIAAHTAIPGEDYRDGVKRTYTSTTEHADYILRQLGLNRSKTIDDRFSDWRSKPVSVAEQGNLRVIQLDDQKNRAYNPSKRDAVGTSGHMHNESARHLPDLWKMLSGWN